MRADFERISIKYALFKKKVMEINMPGNKLAVGERPGLQTSWSTFNLMQSNNVIQANYSLSWLLVSAFTHTYIFTATSCTTIYRQHVHLVQSCWSLTAQIWDSLGETLHRSAGHQMSHSLLHLKLWRTASCEITLLSHFFKNEPLKSMNRRADVPLNDGFTLASPI